MRRCYAAGKLAVDVDIIRIENVANAYFCCDGMRALVDAA
jgi:hypothetical protein